VLEEQDMIHKCTFVGTKGQLTVNMLEVIMKFVEPQCIVAIPSIDIIDEGPYILYLGRDPGIVIYKEGVDTYTICPQMIGGDFLSYCRLGNILCKVFR